MNFNDFTIKTEIPICVYWDDEELTWSSKGALFFDSFYKCGFEKLNTFAVIVQNSLHYLCDSGKYFCF